MTTTRKKLILVDDNEANLTAGKNILKPHYEVYTVTSADKLFSLLEKVHPDLILLDIMMPGTDGYQALKALKNSVLYRDIPVIFLTSKDDTDSEILGLELGAADYIAKPFSGPLLLQRIENHLLMASQRSELKRYNESLEDIVDEKTKQLLELQDAVLNIVAEIVEYRDDITGGHIGRTSIFYQILLEKIVEKGLYAENTADWDLHLLVLSSQLHDIGKVAIPDTILNKPGKLDSDEFEQIKNHVQIGVDMIRGIEDTTGNQHNFLSHAKAVAGSHHEKWDGSGYPFGYSGEGIPLEGRLMAIVDVYDALIARRPYKDPMPPEVAKQIILDNSGTHFDPALVEVFAEVSDVFAGIADELIVDDIKVE